MGPLHIRHALQPCTPFSVLQLQTYPSEVCVLLILGT